MQENNSLHRFVDAQEKDYSIALKEIKNGRKQSHWIWYIFPQLRGLGQSYNADYYGIENLIEAEEYLKNPSLGMRLEEISNALLNLQDNDALLVMGNPDHHKLKSSMTLFSAVPNSSDVFENVLAKFFQSRKCKRTDVMLEKTRLKFKKKTNLKLKI